MLESGVMTDCSDDRDAVVRCMKMLDRLSMDVIHEIPSSWLPLQEIARAFFLHDIIEKSAWQNR